MKEGEREGGKLSLGGGNSLNSRGSIHFPLVTIEAGNQMNLLAIQLIDHPLSVVRCSCYSQFLVFFFCYTRVLILGRHADL